MIQALIPAIAELAGGWLKGKAEKAAAETRAKVAKAEAEAEVMKVAATHEAGWEKVMAEASKDSWKDELWTIVFVVILCFNFVPSMQEIMKIGFQNLEECPLWVQWGMYASIAASFGIRTMRGLGGKK